MNGFITAFIHAASCTCIIKNVKFFVSRQFRRNRIKVIHSSSYLLIIDAFTLVIHFFFLHFIFLSSLPLMPWFYHPVFVSYMKYVNIVLSLSTIRSMVYNSFYVKRGELLTNTLDRGANPVVLTIPLKN